MKQLITPGMTVKLMFEMKDGWCERMWVDVTAVGPDRLAGVLCNSPEGIPRLEPGDKVQFRREHVIDIDVPDELLAPGGSEGVRA